MKKLNLKMLVIIIIVVVIKINNFLLINKNYHLDKKYAI